MHKDKLGTEIKWGYPVVHANGSRRGKLKVGIVNGWTDKKIRIFSKASGMSSVYPENIIIIDENTHKSIVQDVMSYYKKLNS